MKTLAKIVMLIGLLTATPVLAATQAILYKDPQCDCCEGYAAYLKSRGIEVKVVPTHDLTLIKSQHKVPSALEGCHTMLIDGYVVEGHVPYAMIEKLLSEKPKITGISLPGMPLGSPGMVGTKTAPFTVYEIASGPPRIYAVE